MKKFSFDNKNTINELLKQLTPSTNEFLNIDIEQIKPSKLQTRHVFDSDKLEELSQSIEANGLAQPLLVRKSVDDTYELIAGERRLRACKLINLKEVPCVISNADDKSAQILNVIENLQREDLNGIEEASAYAKLKREFNLSIADLARILGKQRPSISNALRLLDASPHVQSLIMSNAIQKGHARALLTLPHVLQDEVAELITKQGLSVRETESIVQSYQESAKPKTSVVKQIHPRLLEKKHLFDNINLPITLNKSQGQGRVVIELENQDHVDEFLKLIESLSN